jgi:hypothetical protein
MADLSKSQNTLILLGFHVPEEDHPQRALYAALRIQDYMRLLRRTVARGERDWPFDQSRVAAAGASQSRLYRDK